MRIILIITFYFIFGNPSCQDSLCSYDSEQIATKIIEPEIAIPSVYMLVSEG